MQGTQLAKIKTPPVHDRTASVAPRHAQAATIVVDDPYGTIPGEKIAVTRAIRDDPLAGLRARNQIDDAMFAAGRKWQEHLENSEIGGVSAIDPTKDVVDGGRFPEPINDHQIRAFKALKQVDDLLGFNKTLVRALLGERMTIQQYSMRIGLTTDREFKQIGWLFRQCLEAMAKMWGFTNRKYTQKEMEEKLED